MGAAPGLRGVAASRVLPGRLGAVAAVTAVAAIAAAVVLIALTRAGVLIGGDSGTYLRSAQWFRAAPRSILDPPVGTDLSVRDLFPPGYPLVLAITHGWLAPRALGVALGAATVGLVVGIVGRRTSWRVAAAVGLLLIVARAWLLVLFGFVMSDGLHLLLALTAACALAPALEAPRDPSPGADHRARWVIAASAAASGAFTVRYAGLGVVAGTVAAIAMFLPTDRRRRLGLAALGAVIGIVPTVAWRIGVAATGAGEERRLGLRKLDGEEWDVIDTMARTYLPRQLTGSVTLVRIVGVPILAAIIVWTIAVVRRALRPTASANERLAATFLLVGWGHHAALVGARLLVDRNVTFGGRYALAWWTFVVAAAALDLHRRALASQHPRRWRRTAFVAVAVLVVGGAPALVRILQQPTEAWSNYAQAPPSPLLRALARTAPAPVVYTNKEDSVWFATGRDTLRLPRRLDHYTGEIHRGFNRDLEQIRRRVAAGRAILVVFRDDNGGFPFDRRLPGVRTAYDGDDGVILTGGTG